METSDLAKVKTPSQTGNDDAKPCTNDEDNAKTLTLESPRDGNLSLYLVAISFVKFIQWFLGIVFFGPAQLVFGSSQRTDLFENQKRSRIFVIEDVSSCEKLLQSYRSQYPFEMNFIGIDCEWVNRKGQANAPVALLQIATPLCDCFLIRLCKMEGRMPQSVKDLLEDKNILKFGVGIQDDVKKLSRMFGFDVWGCVDLRHVVERCRLDNGAQQRNQKMSLDALAKRVLGVTMDKSWRIRCSNWEAEQLNSRQIEYAMNDALVASHIFLRLVKSKLDERKHFVEKENRKIENDSLNLGDICIRDETSDLAFSLSSKCEADINKVNSTVNMSEDNLKGRSPISECFLPEGEPNINEQGNNVELEITENEGTFFGSINHDRNVDKHQESCPQEKDSDSRISGEVSQGFVDLNDLETNCYEVTADLNKLEPGEAEGYLSTEQVIKLLQDPYFSQRACSLCHGVVDVAFKERKRKAIAKEKVKNKECSTEKSSIKPYKRGTVRKSPLYMNCMLAAPDGSRLCTLDRKKADWYIEKEIGHLTCLDPYTVQLNFEPSGRPGIEDSYYLNFKNNICVVCGSDHSYMRKNIVPHDYRRYFPLVMKDHHSHDIVLMCPDCHCLSNYHDDRLRKELATNYDAPLGNATMARLIEDPELRKVKSAAKALNYAGDKLPADRRQELSLMVQEYINAPVLTPEIITQVATMETRKENVNFVSHGCEVVRKIREEGKLLEFEKMWRKHFIDTMRPQYLPPLWSVDHRHEGLKEKLEDCDDFESNQNSVL